MQSYNYRSVKAMAEHRYVKRSRPNRYARSRVWRNEWHDPVPDDPVRRKQRSNKPDPDSSRAA